MCADEAEVLLDDPRLVAHRNRIRGLLQAHEHELDARSQLGDKRGHVRRLRPNTDCFGIHLNFKLILLVRLEHACVRRGVHHVLHSAAFHDTEIHLHWIIRVREGHAVDVPKRLLALQPIVHGALRDPKPRREPVLLFQAVGDSELEIVKVHRHNAFARYRVLCVALLMHGHRACIRGRIQQFREVIVHTIFLYRGDASDLGTHGRPDVGSSLAVQELRLDAQHVRARVQFGGKPDRAQLGNHVVVVVFTEPLEPFVSRTELDLQLVCDTCIRIPACPGLAPEGRAHGFQIRARLFRAVAYLLTSSRVRRRRIASTRFIVSMAHGIVYNTGLLLYDCCMQVHQLYNSILSMSVSVSTPTDSVG